MRTAGLTYAFVLSLFLFLHSSCKKDTDGPPDSSQKTIARIFENSYQFSIFYSAMKKAGLDSLASGAGSYTFFVPDNNAFALSGINGDADLDKMPKEQLIKLVNYHILPKRVLFKEVNQTVGNVYPNLAGKPLYLSRPLSALLGQLSGDVLTVNGDSVKTTDLIGSNSVIHVLQNVLAYPAVSVKSLIDTIPELSFFVAGLKKFGLYDSLSNHGPITIFAPNNQAFQMYGIGLDSIARMDTLTYQKILFSAYILNSQRLFLSDFTDYGGLTLTLSFTQPLRPGLGLNYSFQGGAGYLIASVGLQDPYHNVPLGANQSLVTTYDHWSDNGIVQVISDLLVYPQNVLK